MSLADEGWYFDRIPDLPPKPVTPQRIANFTEAAHVVGELRGRVDALEEGHAQVLSDLDRLATATAKIAVAFVTFRDEFRYEPTRWDRFKVWFRDHVYDGTPQ